MSFVADRLKYIFLLFYVCHLSPFILSKIRLLLLHTLMMMTHVAIEYHRDLRLGENLLMALCVGLHITALMDELFFRSGFKLIIVGRKKYNMGLNGGVFGGNVGEIYHRH